MDLNSFVERFRGLPDKELAEIVANQADYRPEVYELARQEFEFRNIPLELAKDMQIVQLEESEEKALVKAEKLGVGEKVLFVLLPFLGVADIAVRAAEGKLDKRSARLSETAVYLGGGVALWFLIRALGWFF